MDDDLESALLLMGIGVVAMVGGRIRQDVGRRIADPWSGIREDCRKQGISKRDCQRMIKSYQ